VWQVFRLAAATEGDLLAFVEGKLNGLAAIGVMRAVTAGKFVGVTAGTVGKLFAGFYGDG